MNKFMIAIIAATGIALCTPALAHGQQRGMPQPKGTSQVGKSKVYVNQKTRSEVKKQLNREVKAKQAKIQTLETRLADFTTTLKVSPSLRQESGAWQQVNRTINEHSAAKRDLAALMTTKFSTYAAQRSISMVPDPPRTAPPALPQQLLPPPAKASLKQAKAKLPPQR